MYSNHPLLFFVFLTVFAFVSRTTHLSARGMSQNPEIPSIQCSTCGRFVQYTAVKSDTNGNKGRLLAKCLQANPETGIPCKFFRWLAGSRSPSLSPRLGSSIQLPTAAQPTPLPPAPGDGDALVTLRKSTCVAMGCNSTRIRKDCNRRMCKAHCLEAPGCADPAHKGSAKNSYRPPSVIPTLPASIHPVAAPLNGNSTPSTSIDPRLLQSQVQIAPPPPSVPSSSKVPTLVSTEPKHASHMVQVYTKQMALEEQMRENNRQMEATRLESKRKVQQTVYVYAWMEDDVAPAPFEVQEGFVWPNFIMNEAVLESAGFKDISPNIRFNIFRFNLGHWTAVKLNHVVELKDAPRVFIKPTHVRHCQDFESFLSSTSLSATAPNIRTNLAGERAYVKKKMVQYELSQASKTSSTKNKHQLSPNSLASTPKRPRHLSDDTPTPTITRYRPPVPAPKFTAKRVAGATRVVKKTPARQEREMMEIYDSDSGLEFTEPSFGNVSPVPSTSRSASGASTSTTTSASATPAVSASTASTSTPPFSNIAAIVKEEELDSVIPFIIPPQRISKTPKWPADFFAVNIANFFDEVEDSANDNRVRLIFEHHFGQWVEYKRSTYYDHRQRWQTATLEAKQAVLSAGQTEPGCWINLMSTTRAPRAHIKAIRRQTTKQAVEPDVIDISSDCEM